jgi:membrane-bound lytic murein transglycosylase A
MTHIARALASALGAIVLIAGCQQLPATGETASGCPACPICPQCPPVTPPAPREARFEAVEFGALPGWQETALAPSLQAFLKGCGKFAPGHALRRTCDAAASLQSPDETVARSFFETEFSAYSIVAPDGASEGLVTGYYEPILGGSRVRNATHRYPVYGVPDDLVVVDLAGQYSELRGMRLRGRIDGRRLVPYWSRAEIDGGVGRFSAPVLAWLEDPVELFFLQIQGSGQIQLASGERMRVGYAEQNGHPYRSLGRHLVERGELKLEQASMQGIKAWALANPEKLQDALNVNSSYVFFRELAPQRSGRALGVPLSAGYSIAADARFVPLGAPVFLATTMPLSTRPLQRLMVAQDTGGAIRGAVRADFYWGSGAEAGALAGRMRQQGRLWLLWPRGRRCALGRSHFFAFCAIASSSGCAAAQLWAAACVN